MTSSMAGEPSGSASSSSTQTSEPPPPDMGTLREAVAALYTSPDQDQRAAADRWLQWFLRGDHAWPLSIGMLRDATDLTSLEALFCARGLHVLLRRCVSKTEKTQKSHAVLSDDDWAGSYQEYFFNGSVFWHRSVFEIGFTLIRVIPWCEVLRRSR